MEQRCFIFVQAEVSNETSLVLDPEDFLDCDDRKELDEALKEELRDYIMWGDITVDDLFEESLYVPDEFYKEWKDLKKENDI